MPTTHIPECPLPNTHTLPFEIVSPLHISGVNRHGWAIPLLHIRRRSPFLIPCNVWPTHRTPSTSNPPPGGGKPLDFLFLPPSGGSGEGGGTNRRLVFFNATPGCRVHPDERCRPVRTNAPPPSGELRLGLGYLFTAGAPPLHSELARDTHTDPSSKIADAHFFGGRRRGAQSGHGTVEIVMTDV